MGEVSFLWCLFQERTKAFISKLLSPKASLTQDRGWGSWGSCSAEAWGARVQNGAWASQCHQAAGWEGSSSSIWCLSLNEVLF